MNRMKNEKKTIGILTLMLLCSCMWIFKDYILGDKLLVFTDCGSDTFDQYLMWYQSIINHLREGNFSFWDLTNGMGTGMFTLILSNPFLILLFVSGVLFGPDKIYNMMVWLQILQILLSGLAIYGFLSCFKLEEKVKILASYAYALCGYMMVFGQHYHFASVCVLFPFALMTAEKSLRKTKWLLGLTLACTICSVNSLYTGYMQLAVVGFYLLFRVAWEERLFCKSGLSRIGKSYGSMLLGVGMGMVYLLPSAYSIFGVSRRISDAEGILIRLVNNLHPYSFSYYKTLMKRFLSSNLDGINQYTGYQNFYEDPNVFLSALLFLTAVQFFCFFFFSRRNKKQKLLLITAMLLCGFVLLIPTGSMVFNGFQYPFCRYTFLCMPFFAWIMAAGLQEILNNHKLYFVPLVLSAVIIIGEYIRMYLGESRPHAAYLAVLTGIMAIGLCVWGMAKNRKLQFTAQITVAAGLFVTMSMDGYVAYNMERDTLSKTDSAYMEELYEESVQEALNYLKETDTSFYRVEKDYTVGSATSCMNAMAQNYHGISTYNSMLNGNVYQMYANLWPNLQITNDAHYSFANAVNDDFQASLLHVKYVMSKSADLNVQGYECIKQFGNTYLYRNRNTEQIGKFYSRTISASDFEQAKSTINTESLLADALICEDTALNQINADELKQYPKELLAQGEEIGQKIEENTERSAIILSLPPLDEPQTEKYMLEFDLSVATLSYEVAVTAGNHTTKLVAGPNPIHVELSVPGDVEEVRMEHSSTFAREAVLSNKKLYRYEVRSLAEKSAGIEIKLGKNDSIIEGSALVSQDGILMMAIPYEAGWHAYVDGEEVEICQVNYGISGIELTEGNHSIKMVYQCPGLRIGVICSVLSAILTVAVWFLYYRKSGIMKE